MVEYSRMLYDGNELNLEDIEAQLYSQVFHSNNQETTTEPNNLELIDNMRPPNPYFQPGRTSKIINNVNNNNSSNNGKKQKSQLQKKPTNFMKPATQRQQRDLTTLNQVVVVHPFNNSNNIVCLNEVKKQKRKANRRARFKEKKRAARLKLKLQKVLQNTPKPIKKAPPLILSNLEIITLSDSENEDYDKSDTNVTDKAKFIVPKNTDNDEINNDNVTNDDVIFIEPPPIEVINLIEESPQKKQSSDTETASTASSSSSLKNNQKYQPHERKELLNTPESTSNDFMENPNIDLQQGKFNFSLHGSDFANNNESNKQTINNNNNNNNGNNDANKHLEICETESTCSTIDVNTLKATVFTEIEFPKDDLFSEANLENFGNLITPLRSNANRTMITTSTPIQKINNKQICNETDSSSESDLEDTNLNNLQIDKIKKQINLPNLSPIANHNINSDDDNDDDNCNKTNRRKKIGSKFDLIDNERKSIKRKSSESNMNDKKKLNKTKKRKSDVNRDEIIQENPPKYIDINNVDNIENSKIVDNEQNPDTLVLETSLNESIDNYSENTIIENTVNNQEENENVLKDFVIVDEVNNTDINDNNQPVSITESESELSEINEQQSQDITLINCSNPINQPVIEKNIVKDKQDINLKNSSVQEVQQTMSDDPKLWQISERDRSYIRRSTHGRRCTKCRQTGHISIRCPNKKNAPRCRLCGEAGHLVYRCPNSMCVQCGTPGNSSTYCTYCYKFREVFCHICGMSGHIKNRCPDLWRRYHLTTENGPLVTRQGPSLKPKEQLWCSSCAQPGHLEHVCNFTYTPYAKYDPQIYYYHDVYENYNNIEQLYSQSNQNDYQNNQIVPQRCPRYFDNDEFNYQRPDNRNNEMIERNTNVEGYYYNNDRRGFLNSESNNQEYEETVKRMNQYHVFNKKSFGHIVHLLRIELRYLRSIYRDIDNIVRNLKKSYNGHSHLKISSFYKLLNMTLFGIYCFNNGKIHLQRLENLHPQSRRNSLTVRRNLYKSYSFIFGSDRHNNVDYRGLLARI